MKNLFLEKNIIQKLIIALVIVILFNFASPTVCNAKGFFASIGGKLLVPVMELIVAITDGVLNLLQTTLLADLEIITPATSDEMKERDSGWLKILGAVLCVIVIVVGVVTGVGGIVAVGKAAKAAGPGVIALAKAIGGALIKERAARTIIGAGLATGLGTAGAYYFGKGAYEDFKGEFDLPTIVYTPFAIFSGSVPIFDINFFKPSTADKDGNSGTKVVNVADLFESEKTVSNIWGNMPGEDFAEELYKDDFKNRDLYNKVAVVAEWGASFTYYNKYLKDERYYKNNGEVDEAKINGMIAKWISNGVLYIDECWPDEYFKATGMTSEGLGKGLDADLDKIASAVANRTKLDYWDDVERNGTTVEEMRNVVDLNSIDYDEYTENLTIFYVFDADDHVNVDFTSSRVKDMYSEYANIDKECKISEAIGNYTNLEQEVNELYQYLCECADKVNVKKLGEEYHINTSVEQEIAKREQAAGKIKTFEKSSAEVLQNTVAGWYYRLRDLALVCLLIILVYIGIRMVISSTAPEKAKYKQMILNWVVALGILALLHIIMVTTLTITEKISGALIGSCDDTILLDLPKDTRVEGVNGKELKLDVEYQDENGKTQTSRGTLVTNFIGYVRFYVGIFAGDDDEVITAKGIGYIVLYIMLVVQTCMFTWVYGKRVVYMAFLTIIAPLVAITYPIDKIGDGKSQAFDMWLKEYIFNALLQPIHLLIYTVICGNALELMCQSPVYGVIALAFVVPAEKFIRKMFGFEKAQTPSALGGAAGAALAMTGIQRLGNLIRPDGKDDRDADKPSHTEKIRTANAEQQANLEKNAERGEQKAKGIRTTDEDRIRAEENTQQGADSSLPIRENVEGRDESSPIVEEAANPQEEVELNPTVREDEKPQEEAELNSTVREDEKPQEEAGLNSTVREDEKPQEEAEANSTVREDSKPQQEVELKVETGGNTAPQTKEKTDEDAEPKASKPIKKAPPKFTSRSRNALDSWYHMQKNRLEAANTPKKWARRRRKIRRAAIGGALGFGTGLTMAAMKLAMGANANDVATTAIAGGVAGYGIGSKGTQKVQEFEKMDATRQAIREGWYTPEELSKQYDKEYRDKLKEDPAVRAKAREAFPEDWKEFLNGKDGKQGWYDYCLDYGITDIDQAIAAQEYRNSEGFRDNYEKNGVTAEEMDAIAITVARQNKGWGSMLDDPKKRVDVTKAITEQNMRDERIQAMAVQQTYDNRMAEYRERTINDEEYQNAEQERLKLAKEEQAKANEINEELQKFANDELKEAAALNSLQRELAQTKAQLSRYSNESSNIEKDYNARILEEKEYINSNPNLTAKLRQEADDRIKTLENARDEQIKQTQKRKKDLRRQQNMIKDDISKLKTTHDKEIIEQQKEKTKQYHEKELKAIRTEKRKAETIKKNKETKWAEERNKIEEARKNGQYDEKVLKKFATDATEVRIRDVSAMRDFWNARQV